MLTMVLTVTAAGIAICGAIIAVFEIVAAKARRSVAEPLGFIPMKFHSYEEAVQKCRPDGFAAGT
jgi:hypothetical protein